MTIFYVSPTGSDSNGGTGDPLARVAKALSLVSPGDTIKVAPGIYREVPITTFPSGTPSLLITIESMGESRYCYPYHR